MSTSDQIKKWRELTRELVFHKFSRKIEKVVFELPNGLSEDFYIKKEGPTACILPITTNGEIVLVQQYRPGPQEVLNELPGGYVDDDESPAEAIKRELLEETGYTGEIKSIGICFDDAYSTMKRHCFVATECRRVSEQNLGKNEYAKVVLMSLSDFRKLIKSGEMTDVEVGYLALDFLKLL